MFRIIEGNPKNLSDVEEFIKFINRPSENFRDFFDDENDIFIGRVPGRLDVMGGIADYSGSLVLEMPTAEATLTALQKTVERTLKIFSLSDHGNLLFEMKLAEFESGGEPIFYDKAREYFSQKAEDHWASYVAGVFLVLMREKKFRFSQGAKILISSKVPRGKGVSSSAALEVSTMQAVAAAFGIELSGKETANLCQKVENLIVGAACGVMDQMTSACGVENRLMAMLCQPAELQAPIKIPDEIEFWGIDSGVRHAVVGADYGSVRVGAFMGFRIISEIAGLKIENLEENRVKIEDLRWNNSLSNVMPSEFEQYFADKIPEKISGREFLQKYHGTTDAVTKIEPEKVYSVKKPTAHAVYEHFRVRAFAEILKSGLNENKLNLLGELMFQSHASYAACGLCERGTNLLVELVRQDNGENLFGAKITGGGSGGTVAVLASRGSENEIKKIVERYEAETNLNSYIFKDSSPGAFEFGTLRLRNIL
ncbi:MAG: hypothetical protein LUM44_02625 [Pyrinomonadaceae bacterium]|nr:hypothetical protein [Pyrinomonadaceae bacterium]